MSGRRQWGPLLRALAHNRRDYRFLIVATAVGFAVVAHALSLAALFKQASGFDTHVDFGHLAVAEIEAPVSAEAVEETLYASPVVEKLAWVSHRPFAYTEFGEVLAPIDNVHASVLSWPLAGDENLLETLGLPMLAGRNYEPTVMRDDGDIEVVVTESLAHALTGHGPAESVGVRFVDGVKGRVARIVGVTPDIALQVSYVPDPMHSLFFYEPRVQGRRQIALLRTRDSGRAALDGLLTTLREKHGWASIFGGRELRALPDVNNRGGKIVQIMVIGTVLFVALIGHLGAASFSVAERSRHIGIRRALGATRTDIMSYFLDENVFITTAGVILGLPLTYGISWIASSLSPNFWVDWQHLGLSAALFYVTGLLAAHVPALMAARVPPSTASRAA